MTVKKRHPVKQSFLSVFFFVVLVFFISFLGIRNYHEPIQQAPNTTFTTISGETIELKKLKGKPVLVTFWSTSCPACIEEIPHLKTLYRQYSALGLELVAVAMFYDLPNRVLKFTRERKLPYPVVLDPSAKISQAFGDVQFIPTNFLIAPDGSIASKSIGLLDIKSTQSTIQKMLPPG